MGSRKANSLAKAADALLEAIQKEPGITRAELLELELITPGLAGDSRLQALLSNGRAIAIDNRYYPWEQKYLALKQGSKPPAKDVNQVGLRVQVDPTIAQEYKAAQRAEEPSRAAAMLMERDTVTTSSRVSDRKLNLEYWEAVESGEQNAPSNAQEPDQGPALTADKLEPAEVPPTSETVSEVTRRKKATQIAAERRCKDAIAHLEAKGKPFTRNKALSLAGLSSSYFHGNPEMRRLVDEAIARCNPLLAAGPSVAKAMEPVQAHEEPLPNQEGPEVLQIAPELPQAAPEFAQGAPNMPEQGTNGQSEAERRLDEVKGAIAAEREKAVKEQGFLREEIEELTNLYKAAERQQEFCDRLLKALGVEA